MSNTHNIYIRKSKPEDLNKIMEIYRIAQDYMIQAGNPDQWGHFYPSRELIADDIEKGISYVICESADGPAEFSCESADGLAELACESADGPEEFSCDRQEHPVFENSGKAGNPTFPKHTGLSEHADRICGVVMLREGDEPTYQVIEDGAWLNDEPYVTIHRAASDGSAHGIVKAIMEHCKARWDNIRIDTHGNNVTMQHQIEKNGFQRCGIIHVDDGSPRIAYQWTRGKKGPKGHDLKGGDSKSSEPEDSDPEGGEPEGGEPESRKTNDCDPESRNTNGCGPESRKMNDCGPKANGAPDHIFRKGIDENEYLSKSNGAPDHIKIRGARVHNLKNIDVDVPLHKIVGVAGVSGSGKSSLALGVLYAEGSRRYLEALSTYTRRRMTQAAKADVDEVLYVPASLALHQRPGVPGIRSTFGTGTELLNSIRLMFSRLASHRCPNGHYHEPTLAVAADQELVCPECEVHFYAPGAEELAFNSQGACEHCGGTGMVRTVDRATLIPDESLTIDEGAVAPWNSLMWSLMTDVCREMGVRTDIPFRDLTDAEKDIVYNGPAEKKHIFYKAKNSNVAGEMDFTYFNAVYTVENALSKVKDEKGMKRVEKFLKEELCPECGGTRLSEKARAPRLNGMSLDEVCKLSLEDVTEWVKEVPASLPEKMRPMAESICESYHTVAKRLVDLGLSYLSLDRAASTLSTGERQRMQLARAVRNRTTGVLYVLDEPSIGLHPANIEGLNGVIHDLTADGNSVLLVDHDIQILKESDWIIELGPQAGADGGKVIAEGTVKDIINNAASQIGPFLAGKTTGSCLPAGRPAIEIKRSTDETGRSINEAGSTGSDSCDLSRTEACQAGASNTADRNTSDCSDLSSMEACQAGASNAFDAGSIHLSTSAIHTVKPLEVDIPKGRLTVVTGVSGSGKTTMILESLIPALESVTRGRPMPEHIRSIDAEGIEHIKLIDASPIGINVRSTVATYANVHDELRKIYARTPDAKEQGYKAGAFSYNTGKLRCPVCDGTGSISLDVQFLPDVNITCPQCRGARYDRIAYSLRHTNKAKESCSLPELMALDVNHAIVFCKDMKKVYPKLKILQDLGLGYLTLGEETPSLSGGEAQRLKLASEMGKTQSDSVFVFDEPTIGLHPLDVQTLMDVFRTLIENGATVIVIEHDLDVIRNADYIIDMGPGGGASGGRIVASGAPEEIASNPASITRRYI